MDNEVIYRIENANGETIEKGYVNAETVDDDEPEIYVENNQGFYEPENPYGESPQIDRSFLLEAIWDCRYGAGYEYEDNSYNIIIN